MTVLLDFSAVNMQKKKKKSLTISTSEMASRLSTCTSTPTGIAGPENKTEGFLSVLSLLKGGHNLRDN